MSQGPLPTADTTETTAESLIGLGGFSGGLEGILWVHPEYRFTPLSGKEQATFGRSSQSDYQLEGRRVSRHHAVVYAEPPQMVLEDLDSRNGSHLNAQKVTRTPLTAGDLVRLGDWVGIVTSLPLDRIPLCIPQEVAPGLVAGPTLRAILDRARQVAQSVLSVIFVGPTGAGKEVLSKYLHDTSRRTGPFIAVNCAALPESLAEAMLFGHRKGAFTGADRDQPGFFRAANGGTLFLDEVLELPLGLQAKLLRALEERTVTPVGQTQAVPVDVRMVCAAQTPLAEVVKAGRFRADLYARLNGIELFLPSLREQRELIPALFSLALKESRGGTLPRFSAELVECLCLYDWPFNAREVVQTARQVGVLYGDRGDIDREVLPERILETIDEGRSSALPPVNSIERGEAPVDRLGKAEQRRATQLEQLVRALRTHNGNVSKAAQEVGISRQQAYRLMDKKPELELTELRRTKD